MRQALLTHDAFGITGSKTAACIVRFHRDTVACVIDRSQAGRDAGDVLGYHGKGVPIVASVQDAARLGADTLTIGVAPIGGRLPPDWRAEIRWALERGWTLVNGLHEFFADDPELAAAAKKGKGVIRDVRRPPPTKRIATGEGRRVRAPVVLTVGTDCSSGKMTTAVEIVQEFRRRGIDAGFAATGQTGIMVGCDAGAAVDAVVADFIAGETESLVLQCAAKGKNPIIVEGQGSLTHPAYSGVTLGLLHGAFPDLLVMCHEPARKTIGGYPDFPRPSLTEEIRRNEALLAPMTRGRVVAVSLMNPRRSRAEAEAEVRAAEKETGLPAADVFHEGPGKIVDALLEAMRMLPGKAAPR